MGNRLQLPPGSTPVSFPRVEDTPVSAAATPPSVGAKPGAATTDTARRILQTLDNMGRVSHEDSDSDFRLSTPLSYANIRFTKFDPNLDVILILTQYTTGQ